MKEPRSRAQIDIHTHAHTDKNKSWISFYVSETISSSGV